MTIKELIEELKTHPDYAEVYFEVPAHGYGPADEEYLKVQTIRPDNFDRRSVVLAK